LYEYQATHQIVVYKNLPKHNAVGYSSGPLAIAHLSAPSSHIINTLLETLGKDSAYFSKNLLRRKPESITAIKNAQLISDCISVNFKSATQS
jgi:hypothetical protein